MWLALLQASLSDEVRWTPELGVTDALCLRACPSSMCVCTQAHRWILFVLHLECAVTEIRDLAWSGNNGVFLELPGERRSCLSRDATGGHVLIWPRTLQATLGQGLPTKYVMESVLWECCYLCEYTHTPQKGGHLCLALPPPSAAPAARAQVTGSRHTLLLVLALPRDSVGVWKMRCG